jgi:hypothetical protein
MTSKERFGGLDRSHSLSKSATTRCDKSTMTEERGVIPLFPDLKGKRVLVTGKSYRTHSNKHTMRVDSDTRIVALTSLSRDDESGYPH